MVCVRITGSDEMTVDLLRVPCIGERIRTHGMARKVVMVEHVTTEYPAGSPIWMHPPDPTAIVTVADE